MESRSGSKPTLYMKRERYPEDEGLAIWQKKKNHVFIESQKGKKKNYSWQDSSTRTFFITAADYMVSKFPCSSDVVMYTCFSTQL